MSRRNGSHGSRQQVGGSREPPITNSSQDEFQITKKIIAGAVAFCAAACLTVNAFAATLIHFTVNNVKITGELSYFDSLGGNPFDNDSVTAITSSTSVMDHIEAHATLYYTKGEQRISVTQPEGTDNASYIKATVSKYTLATGYKGEGLHMARHGGKFDCGNTSVTW